MLHRCNDSFAIDFATRKEGFLPKKQKYMSVSRLMTKNMATFSAQEIWICGPDLDSQWHIQPDVFKPKWSGSLHTYFTIFREN